MNRLATLTLGLLLGAGPALAQDIMIGGAYAYAATPAARSGAVYMEIMNHGAADDRLIAAATGAAQMTGLHRSAVGADGMATMSEIEGGLQIPAGATVALARGGDHVMLMGLTAPLVAGESVTLTLTFEVAGEITIEAPVDLTPPEEGHETGADAHAGHGG